MEKKKKATRTENMYGILNAYGEFWTPVVFAYISEAGDYIRKFEERYKTDMSKHKVVKVKVKINQI